MLKWKYYFIREQNSSKKFYYLKFIPFQWFYVCTSPFIDQETEICCLEKELFICLF